MSWSWHTLSSCTRRQKKQLDIQRGNLQSGGRITRRPHCEPLLIMCCCLVARGVRLPACHRSLGLRVYLPSDANLTLCQRACCCQTRARCVWWQIRVRAPPLILIKRIVLCMKYPRCARIKMQVLERAASHEMLMRSAREWPQACGFHVCRVCVFCLTYI